jgi:hypothetical protein
VTRPGAGIVEISIGRRRRWLWALQFDVARMLLAAAVAGAIVGVVTAAVGRSASGIGFSQHAMIVGGGVFSLLIVQLIRVRVRDHAIKTTFRITPDRLDLSIAGWFGQMRAIGWPRRDVFEVRPSKGGLHVRLVHDHPCRLLRYHSPAEVRAVATAMSEALAEVVPVPVVGDDSLGGALTYAVAGRPYEIVIRRTPDGLSVVVPGAGDRAVVGFAGWLIGATILASVTAGYFLGPWAASQFHWSRRTPLIYVVGWNILPAAIVYGAAYYMLRRIRGGQPLVILIDDANVRIDHPGMPIRRRRWKRECVTDVCVETRKGRNDQIIEHFVRMRAGARRSVAFCHARESIEMQRVVTAIRTTLGLASLPDDAFPKDASIL